MKELLWKLILPLTIISFSLFTKWWYAVPVDSPDTIFYGFPRIWIGPAYHTSLAYQIFVLDLIYNVGTFFLFWTIVFSITHHYVATIVVGRILAYALICISMVPPLLVAYFLYLDGGNNVYYRTTYNTNFMNEEYGYKLLETGYMFSWEKNPRPRLDKTINN